MKNKNIYITKASGKKELFDGRKIYRTAIRAGASNQLAKETEQEIEKKLEPNISSNKILNYALEYLKNKEKTVAIKYNLKRGIMELGPSGYPFEKYVGMILKEYGYAVQLNQQIQGHCLTYEIDVLAEKENKIFVVECKYYNRPGLRSNSKVALYTYARFLDIKKHWTEKLNKPCNPCKGLLVTNTKCTTDAIKYAKCVGMEIIGWHYPEKQGLEHLIEQKKLYPITSFPSLKKQIKDQLISNDVILIKDLLNLNIEKLAQKSGIPIKELQVLKNTAQNIYKNNN